MTLPQRLMPWWGITVTLLLAALICWVALLPSLISGYPWDDHSLVPTDGQSHTIEMKRDSQAMMWAHETTVTPTCTAVDAATGAALPLSLVDGAYRRAGGMVGGKWVGIVTFPTQSGSVDVTCDDGGGNRSRGRLGRGGGILMAVEEVPAGPATLASLGPWGAIPVGLTLAGLLGLGAAVVARLRHRVRSRNRSGVLHD